jgi:hypothetical protein
VPMVFADATPPPPPPPPKPPPPPPKPVRPERFLRGSVPLHLSVFAGVFFCVSCVQRDCSAPYNDDPAHKRPRRASGVFSWPF